MTALTKEGPNSLQPLYSGHPPAPYECSAFPASRQDKRALHFLLLQGKHLVLKTTPLVPGRFKVQHLQDNLCIFIRR